jgi:hypothetical protein
MAWVEGDRSTGALYPLCTSGRNYRRDDDLRSAPSDPTVQDVGSTPNQLVGKVGGRARRPLPLDAHTSLVRYDLSRQQG